MKAIETYLRNNFEYFLNEELVKNFVQSEVLRLVSASESSLVFESLTPRFIELNYVFRTVKNKEVLDKTKLVYYKTKISLYIADDYFAVLDMFVSNYQIENVVQVKTVLDSIIKRSLRKVEIHLPLSDNNKYVIEKLSSLHVDFNYRKNDYTFKEKKLINLLRKVSTVIGVDNFCEKSQSSSNSIKRYYKNSNDLIEAVTEISGDLNIRILSNVLNHYCESAKIY